MCGVMMEMVSLEGYSSLNSSSWLLALLKAELSIEMLSSNREEGVDAQGDTDKADEGEVALLSEKLELIGEADELILRLFRPWPVG